MPGDQQREIQLAHAVLRADIEYAVQFLIQDLADDTRQSRKAERREKHVLENSDFLFLREGIDIKITEAGAPGRFGMAEHIDAQHGGIAMRKRAQLAFIFRLSVDIER